MTDIALRNGYGRCDIAAKEMARTLEERGEEYKIITLVCRRGYPHENVWCEDRRTLAGTNSFHMGVLYKGMVYCTIYPYGRPQHFWENVFECRHGVLKPLEGKLNG